MSSAKRRVAHGKNLDVNMISLSPYSTMMDEGEGETSTSNEDALVIASSSRVPIRGDEAERRGIMKKGGRGFSLFCIGWGTFIKD